MITETIVRLVATRRRIAESHVRVAASRAAINQSFDLLQDPLARNPIWEGAGWTAWRGDAGRRLSPTRD